MSFTCLQTSSIYNPSTNKWIDVISKRPIISECGVTNYEFINVKKEDGTQIRLFYDGYIEKLHPNGIVVSWNRKLDIQHVVESPDRRIYLKVTPDGGIKIRDVYRRELYFGPNNIPAHPEIGEYSIMYLDYDM